MTISRESPKIRMVPFWKREKWWMKWNGFKMDPFHFIPQNSQNGYLSLHFNSHNYSTKFKNTLYIHNRHFNSHILQAEMDRQHNRGLLEKPFFGDFVTLSQLFYRETEKLKTTQQEITHVEFWTKPKLSPHHNEITKPLNAR